MALTTNLEVYLKMDESSGTPADSSSNAFTQGSSGTTYGAGKINNGCIFTGATPTYVTLSASVPTPNDVTIACWVKFNNITASKVVWCEGANGYADIEFDGSVSGALRIFCQTSGTGRTGFSTAGSTVTTGVWYYLVYRYDSATGFVDLWINNVRQIHQSMTGTQSWTIARTNWSLGGYNQVFANFSGTMDEFGLWSRALSDAELTTLYNSGNGVQYPFSTAYTLAIAQGSYTLTGQVLTLFVGHTIIAAQGSYTLTGQAVAFILGKLLTAIQGSYTLTGQNVGFIRTWIMPLVQGAYTLTGQAVGLAKNLSPLVIVQGVYTYTGVDVNFYRAILMSIVQGAYTLTGQAITFTRAIIMSAVQGSYTYTGFSTLFPIAYAAMAVAQGVYALTGQALIMIVSRGTLSAITGYYTTTGFSIRFQRYWRNLAKNLVSWIDQSPKTTSSFTNVPKEDI